MPERMRVAVLGAGGFIGSRLTEWLVLRDLAEVRPITRSFSGLVRGARFAIDARIADATDQRSLQPHLEGCQVVFHCVVGTRKTILDSIDACYGAAAAAGVRRMVYLSSAVVHGHNPAPGTHDDSDLVRNQPFEYNAAKVLAEQRLAAVRHNGRVETVVLRPSIVFGPRSRWWTAQIAEDLLSGKACLVDEGAGLCNTIYVDNLVHAMWLAATHPGAANQVFLVSDGERITWRQFYLSVATALRLDERDIRTASKEQVDSAHKARLQENKLARIRESRLGQIARAITPLSIKQTARSLLVNPGPTAGQATSTAASDPPVDFETASLQQCGWQMPNAKAEALIGYQPPVSFEEACFRTGAWLRFVLGVPHGDYPPA